MKIKGSKRRHVRVNRERDGERKSEGWMFTPQILAPSHWEEFKFSGSSFWCNFDTSFWYMFHSSVYVHCHSFKRFSFRFKFLFKVLLTSWASLAPIHWVSEWVTLTHSLIIQTRFSLSHSFIQLSLSHSFIQLSLKDGKGSRIIITLVIIHLNPFLFHPFHYFLYHSLFHSSLSFLLIHSHRSWFFVEKEEDVIADETDTHRRSLSLQKKEINIFSCS